MDRRLRRHYAASSPAANLTYDQEVLADSPLGYWRMQDTGSAIAVDSSGNGRDLTKGAATSQGVIPVVFPGAAGCFAFNGSSNGIVSRTDEAWMSPHAGSSGQMTFECWVNFDDFATIRTLWWKGATSNFEYSVTVSTTGVLNYTWFTAAGGTAGSVSTGAGAISAATDYYLVGTYNRAANATAAFINGALAATGTTSADSAGGTANLFFGKRASLDDRFLLGRSSHQAIYGTELTATRIAAHYAAA